MTFMKMLTLWIAAAKVKWKLQGLGSMCWKSDSEKGEAIFQPRSIDFWDLMSLFYGELTYWIHFQQSNADRNKFYFTNELATDASSS